MPLFIVRRGDFVAKLQTHFAATLNNVAVVGYVVAVKRAVNLVQFHFRADLLQAIAVRNADRKSVV